MVQKVFANKRGHNIQIGVGGPLKLSHVHKIHSLKFILGENDIVLETTV